MCLIAFSFKDHPRYKLVLAANRDEFYERPTRGAQFWGEEGHPDILAGKDLKAGGTWMGVHKDGRWGALTNYRDLTKLKEDPPSRGALVIDFLKQDIAAQNYLESIRPDSDLYNGFNLLLGDDQGVFHFSNQEQQITPLDPGVHGLSNALLNTPWPKLERAKSDLEQVISSDFQAEDLFNVLLNDVPAPDDQLPETGMTKELEKAVSSVFIKTENYGTRCSTLLLIDHEDQITFIERRYKAGSTEMIEEKKFSL